MEVEVELDAENEAAFVEDATEQVDTSIGDGMDEEVTQVVGKKVAGGQGQVDLKQWDVAEFHRVRDFYGMETNWDMVAYITYN